MLTGDDLVLCPAPSGFDVAETVRAAVFYVLITNADRESSWFRLASPWRPRLLAHSHSFGVHATTVQSVFVSLHAHEALGPTHRQALQTLTAEALTRLSPPLPPAALASVGARGHNLLDGASLSQASS
jgi:hypothetical protein